LHQVAFPTHYYTEARALLQRILRWVQPSIPGYAALATAPPGAYLALRLLGGLAFAVYVGSALASTSADAATPLSWLWTYVGWPALTAACIGVFLWARDAPGAAERFALVLGILVLAHLVVDPRVTPAPLWAIRRFLPVVVPMLVLASSLALGQLWRRRWWLGLLGLVALLAGTGSRQVIHYRGDAFQNSMAHVRTLAALLPKDAVLAVNPSFGALSQVHIALWSAADVPTYLLEAEMSEPLLALRDTLDGRPLYWLGGGSPSGPAALGRIADPVASYRFAVRLRRLDWYDPRDEAGVREETLWLYRLRPREENDAAPAGALH
jgi:hypothetical protein